VEILKQMKLVEIRKLVEKYSKKELIAAEKAFLEESLITIEVGGDDEGEQLTHIMAATWIRTYMDGTGENFREAQREYVNMVRKSLN
jgi:hypothetical protein